MSKCPNVLQKSECTMFYTKVDLLSFQVEQSSRYCLGDRVRVNESLYPLHFLLRCFKSLLWQDAPASGLIWASGSASLALGLFLKTMHAIDLHLSFVIILCFPLIVRLSIPYSWQQNRTVDGIGRSWWRPGVLRLLHPISVWYVAWKMKMGFTWMGHTLSVPM